MKKFLKVFGIVVGAGALILIIGVVLVLKQLPSSSQIGQYLRPSNAKTALKSLDKKDAASEPLEQVKNSDGPAAQTATSATAEYQLSSQEDLKLLDDLTDQQRPLSEVCGSLKNSDKIQMNGYSFKSFGQSFKESVFTENKDPVIQALKPSIRYLFNLPNMKALMEEAVSAAEKGEDTNNLLDKAGFYAKAYAAYNELQNNKQNIEHIMDRSYHLMILSKVIAKKPELLADSAVKNYCMDIESALNGSTPLAFEEERQAFSDFIKESGVSPQEVGYDPNYRTELKIEMSNKGSGNLHMKGGWIESILKPTPEEIEAFTQQAERKGK